MPSTDNPSAMCPQSFKWVTPSSQLGTVLCCVCDCVSASRLLHGLSLDWTWAEASASLHIRDTMLMVRLYSFHPSPFCFSVPFKGLVTLLWLSESLSPFLWNSSFFISATLFFIWSAFSPPSYSIVLFDLKCKSDWVWSLTKILLKIHLTWVL